MPPHPREERRLPASATGRDVSGRFTRQRRRPGVLAHRQVILTLHLNAVRARGEYAEGGMLDAGRARALHTMRACEAAPDGDARSPERQCPSPRPPASSKRGLPCQLHLM